ncbi:C1 family peptidase [Streptomyces sp. NPDC048409]|uniref:C1 family peptidase n=1 Tax=Streptomyces sp. NPDC048409 TaxID=3154723 RepID=UPI00342E8FBD
MRSPIAVGLAAAVTLSCLTTAVATTTASAAETTSPHGTARHATTLNTGHLRHGLGLDLDALRAKSAVARTVHEGARPVFRHAEAAPESADLSQYALPPGDQGQVGACVAWATGYSAYGIVMNEQGISGAPMAPMYVYAQIAKGQDNGTTASVALPMEKEQGIDTQADYWQGTSDYTTQPDDQERANAAKYRLSGFDELPTGGDEAKAAIQNAVSQGEPVVIGFEVHKSFEALDATTAADYSYMPGDASSDPVVGGHEVTIVGYDDKGVKIENSWGAGWGDGGFFTVPWSFFSTGDVDEIHAVGKIATQS